MSCGSCGTTRDGGANMEVAHRRRARVDRPLPREQLPQDEPDGEEIAARIEGQPAALLGRLIGARDPAFPHERLGQPVPPAGQAEVGQLHLTFVRAEDARGRDVPVDQILVLERVQIGQPSQRLARDVEGETQRKRQLPLGATVQDVPQRLAPHVLGDEEGRLAGRMGLGHVEQVGVVEERRQAGLVDEPAQVVLIGVGQRPQRAVLDREHLDGAQAAAGVGQEHAAEPTLPKLLEQ